MLGAKRIKECHIVEVQTGTERRWSWRHFKHIEKPTTTRITEVDHLTEKILDNCTTAQLREITFALVKEGGLDDFLFLPLPSTQKPAGSDKGSGKTTAYGHS